MGRKNTLVSQVESVVCGSETGQVHGSRICLYCYCGFWNQVHTVVDCTALTAFKHFYLIFKEFSDNFIHTGNGWDCVMDNDH